MKLRRVLTVAGCLLAVAFLGRQVFSQHEEPEEQGQPQMSEEEAKMWEAITKAGTPGEHHKHLEPLVGTWKVHSRYRMSPEAEWGESTGTGKFEWIMDGRYILEHIEATMEGMPLPFRGLGILGYDNIANKHFSVWIDNMSTGTMTSTGTCDDSGKTITYYGETPDAVTGQMRKEKSVQRVINDNKHVFQMFKRDDAGKEYLSLEVTYTR